MPANRADELLVDMVETTKAIYFNTHWVEWADGWISGRDRSAVSAERILRRIRALQGHDDDDSTDASGGAADRGGLHELADLLTQLPERGRIRRHVGGGRRGEPPCRLAGGARRGSRDDPVVRVSQAAPTTLTSRSSASRPQFHPNVKAKASTPASRK